MTVEIEHVLAAEDVRQFIEAAEQAGSLRAGELSDLVETHELAPLEAEALQLGLEQRGIDIVEGEREPEPQPQQQPVVYETTTDALQLFLREAGRHPLLTALSLLIESAVKDLVLDTVLSCYVGYSPGDEIKQGNIRPGSMIDMEGAIWFSDIRKYSTHSQNPEATELATYVVEKGKPILVPAPD